jgi:hypothetical protein
MPDQHGADLLCGHQSLLFLLVIHFVRPLGEGVESVEVCDESGVSGIHDEVDNSDGQFWIVDAVYGRILCEGFHGVVPGIAVHARTEASRLNVADKVLKGPERPRV